MIPGSTILIASTTRGHGYRFCLRVDSISPFPIDGWNIPAPYVHMSCTRMDWDGQTVGGHPCDMHVVIARRKGPGLWKVRPPCIRLGPSYYRELQQDLFS